MHRRRFVELTAAGVAGAVPGCLGGGGDGGPGGIRLDRATTDVLLDATEVRGPPSGGWPRLVVGLLERLVAGEGPTVEAVRYGDDDELRRTRRSPLAPLQQLPSAVDLLVFVRADGAYHAVSEVAVDHGTVTGRRYDLSWEPDAPSEDASSGRTVGFTELPASDRWRVAQYLGYAPLDWIAAAAEEGAARRTTVVFGSLAASGADSSRLARAQERALVELGPDFAASDRRPEAGIAPEAFQRRVAGLPHTVLALDQRDEAPSRAVRRYRYRAARVADTDDDFAAYLRRERGAVLDGLTSAERNLLDEARSTDGELRVDDERRDALERLEDRLPPRAPGEPHVVAYDDEWYVVSIERIVV